MQKNIRLNQYLNAIVDYCEAHSSPPSPVLYELERETHLKTLAPQMMSGHLQGAFFSLLSTIKQPKYILEVGTFTGYAAICLATGLQKDGQLITIEINEELEYISRKYFEKAGLGDQVIQHIGDAKDIIPTLDLSFDLVFLDASKLNYGLHYDLIIDKVSRGGMILADNTLWSGKVVDQQFDKDTISIKAFNQKIQDDPRVTNVLLPVRDGITIAIKNG